MKHLLDYTKKHVIDVLEPKCLDLNDKETHIKHTYCMAVKMVRTKALRRYIRNQESVSKALKQVCADHVVSWMMSHLNIMVQLAQADLLQKPILVSAENNDKAC